jgi:ElaB/YqjD/DUF883 family membrane-anchored ribosome-binding protein
MENEQQKKELSEELQKNIDETIDDVDQLTRKTANRFSQFLVKASMEKFEKILNNGKAILKEKVKEGLKHGKTKKRQKRSSKIN